MERISGVAANTRHNVLVTSEEGTSDVVEFDLAGRRVRWESRRRAEISDGDELVVAGRPGDGVFKAWAYRNLTNSTASHRNAPPSPALRIAALVLLGLGAAALAAFLLTPWTSVSLVLATLGGSLLLAGVVILRVMKNAREAVELVYGGGRGGA